MNEANQMCHNEALPAFWEKYGCPTGSRSAGESRPCLAGPWHRKSFSCVDLGGKSFTVAASQ